jgi:hypothetical protein
VNSGTYSILMVRFSFVIHVKNLLAQHLNGGSHIAAAVGFKDWPVRQCIIGEPSAAGSFSEPYKFLNSASDLHKALVSTGINHSVPKLPLCFQSVQKCLLHNSELEGKTIYQSAMRKY